MISSPSCVSHFDISQKCEILRFEFLNLVISYYTEIQSWGFELVPGVPEARRCQSRDLKLISGTLRFVSSKIVDDRMWKYMVTNERRRIGEIQSAIN